MRRFYAESCRLSRVNWLMSGHLHFELTKRVFMGTKAHVIENFAINFQKRNRAALVEAIDPEFVWIDPNGQIVAQGIDAFFSGIDGLWADHPNVQNSSSICLEIWNLVTHTESFSGYDDGHTESWVWVYEFKGERIYKMYGFKNEDV